MSRGETEIMDVPQEGQARDAGQDVPPNVDSAEDPSAEPEETRTTEDHTESPSEEAPSSDRMGHESTDHSLTEDVSANEKCCLIPQHASTPNHIVRTDAPTRKSPAPGLQNGHTPPRGVANGALPVCTPPTVSGGHPGWPSAQSPKSSAPVHPDKKRLPSTSTNSQHSLKTTAAQIQQVAGDDCCVHCVLACLFCELLSLCSVLAQCLACGRGCETLCCCGGGATGGVACGEEACSAGLDCGMLEDCCESSDCLEICLECCSICFPA
ncbi:myoD family inhibitor domain-containing protein [Megalops cyprinoides]|uniref:myoD family inhibitor domain-containing protein n=1 Tax=Megalops cyprinoides TaxID=118141 RepID=UPI001864A9E8|nr:myoD family inhibitor domain-containing protein [Megalops cyprinoides]